MFRLRKCNIVHRELVFHILLSQSKENRYTKTKIWIKETCKVSFTEQSFLLNYHLKF